MLILGTIIRTLIINVLSRQAEGSNCEVIGSEFIGCELGWRPTLFPQQLAHQLQRCYGVPLRLHEAIQDLAFIVDGASEPMALPMNHDDHLIKMPIVAGRGSLVAQVPGIRRTKFEEPAPYALVGNIQTLRRSRSSTSR